MKRLIDWSVVLLFAVLVGVGCADSEDEEEDNIEDQVDNGSGVDNGTGGEEPGNSGGGDDDDDDDGDDGDGDDDDDDDEPPRPDNVCEELGGVCISPSRRSCPRVPSGMGELMVPTDVPCSVEQRTDELCCLPPSEDIVAR